MNETFTARQPFFVSVLCCLQYLYALYWIRK